MCVDMNNFLFWIPNDFYFSICHALLKFLKISLIRVIQYNFSNFPLMDELIKLKNKI